MKQVATTVVHALPVLFHTGLILADQRCAEFVDGCLD
jgi:hypothetical protein